MATPAGEKGESSRRADALVAAALRTGQFPDLAAEDGVTPASFLERSSFHGVSALLLNMSPGAAGWPPAIYRGLQEEAVYWIAHEVTHKLLLSRLIADMTRRGLCPLLMKGTPLAYTLYPLPELRTRCDTDMMVRPEEREAAHAALIEAGFRQSMSLTGTGVSYEAGYTMTDHAGITHIVDLHWRLNNSEVLSSLFTFDELSERAVALPLLGPDARGLGPIDALLLGCLHRRLDDRVADRLIWLYDVHLLLGAFGAGDWEDLVRLARAKGLAGATLVGIEQARSRLGTPCPAFALDELARARDEVPETYLRASPQRREWMDFCARPGVRTKLQYVATTCFPSAEFMRHSYPGSDGVPLAWLYVRRAIDGVRKRLGMKTDST